VQAAVVNVLGQAPVFQSFPDPVAGAGEVEVKVRAAGLHPVVKAIASGAHYSAGGEVPAVPGIDGVGTLEDGSRVYFGGVRKPWGTMAERAVVAGAMCIPLPDGIDDAQAAAIANPGMSACVSLKNRAEVAAGETVLILGATGVAGQLALQAARLMGAKRVIGAGRNVGAIAQSGADAVIALGEPEDAVREAFAAEAAKGIDAGLSPKNFSLARRGRVRVAGQAAILAVAGMRCRTEGVEFRRPRRKSGKAEWRTIAAR